MEIFSLWVDVSVAGRERGSASRPRALDLLLSVCMEFCFSDISRLPFYLSLQSPALPSYELKPRPVQKAQEVHRCRPKARTARTRDSHVAVLFPDFQIPWS